MPLGKSFSSVPLVDSISIVFISSKKRTLSSMPLENVAFFFIHIVVQNIVLFIYCGFMALVCVWLKNNRCRIYIYI